MANVFQVGETVICSITVKDATGTLQDPIDSMKIEVNQITPNYAVKVASTGMTDDTGVGAYHYDCQTAGYSAGLYEIIYTADDGTRITVQKDTFVVE